MKQFAISVWNGLLKVLSKIHWPRIQAVLNGGMYYRLTESDHDRIRQLLRDHYCIIFTRRSCHLTTYSIVLATLVATRKIPHYVHVLMNVEDEIDDMHGYKLIEATTPGVHYSTFMEVFDCDSVALLKPRGVSLEEWTRVMDYVKASCGKQYDTLFDVSNDLKVSCVELIYWGLKMLPNFEQRFPKLIEMMSKPNTNLTPQMLYDTGELDIVFEVRR